MGRTRRHRGIAGVPNPQVKPYYDHGGITIYHGDCREVREWASADVLVTDPPYGVGWLGYANKGQARIPITGDHDASVRDCALEIWGDKPALVFGSWRVAMPRNTRNRLIWYKRGQNPGPLNAPFMSQDEEIYVIGEGFISSSPPLRSVIETRENRSTEVAAIGHPTPKPIGLLDILLRRCVGTVADPFMGSGSTLVAAKNLRRKAIGIEIEERYCEIAAERLRQEVLGL